MNKPDDTDFFPDILPPFDIGAALGRLNGKKSLLRKLLIKFHDIYINAIPTLNEMVAKGELEEAARLAHSIKGGAGNLEAADVFESSRLVELALSCKSVPHSPEVRFYTIRPYSTAEARVHHVRSSFACDVHTSGREQ